jgi:outer membrane immunogenic protein
MAQSAVVVGLLGTPVMAVAADFSPPPVGKAVPYAQAIAYRWDGLYVGINGGGMFGSSNWTLAANDFNTAGWMFGGTVGYNMQLGRFVVGLEGDLDFADVNGSTTLGGCGAGCKLKQDFLSTFRGRIGFAVDRFLPYFTAGGAYGRIKVSQGLVGSQEKWELGYTVGAGLEAAMWDGWTAKGEYMFVDFGNFSCSPICGGGGAHVNYFTNIWRLGLNYRF